MSLNFVGGAVGVLALVGILYLHGCHRTVTSPNVSERVQADIKPATEPAKVAPVRVEKPVPVEQPAKAKPAKFPDIVPCIGDGKCGPRREAAHVPAPAPAPRKPVYHKVLKGGVVDGPADCKHVPPVAKQYPRETVLKYAKQLGLTEAQMSELRVCLN